MTTNKSSAEACKQFLNKACLIWAYFGGIILLILVFIASYNAIVNGLSNINLLHISGFQGYEDFVRLLISCSALMFFPLTQFVRGHVSVDFFTDYILSEKAKNILDKMWLSITSLLIMFLAINMYYGMLTARDDEVVTSVLQWSEWMFYIPGIISLLLWIIVLIYQICSNPNPKNRALDNGLKQN